MSLCVRSLSPSIRLLVIHRVSAASLLRMLQDYALLFIRKDFTCALPCHNVIQVVQAVNACVCSYVLSHSWISPEKMPFVVEERGKENVVPVRLLSRERLVCSISVALLTVLPMYSTRIKATGGLESCALTALCSRNIAGKCGFVTRFFTHAAPRYAPIHQLSSSRRHVLQSSVTDRGCTSSFEGACE